MTRVDKPALCCSLASGTHERLHRVSECRSGWQSGAHISLGSELKAPTLQSLHWSISPVLEWVAGSTGASAPPWLEGSYRDKNLDSEENTPAFQRGCYQDGTERLPWDCAVSTSAVYIFLARDSGRSKPGSFLEHCFLFGRTSSQKWTSKIGNTHPVRVLYGGEQYHPIKDYFTLD